MRVATAGYVLVSIVCAACQRGSSKQPMDADASTAQVDTPGEAQASGTLAGTMASEGKSPVGMPPPPDVASPPPQARRSETGLAWVILQQGAGARPGPDDLVTMHFTAWRPDGTMIDSTRLRDEPEVFALNRVILGWTEGLSMMRPGEKRRFWVPAKLAYGDAPVTAPGEPREDAPTGDLVFDIEFISSRAVPPPPMTPRDVANVPKNASRADSGLASRVLRKGTGIEHPTVISEVTLHYSGWTTDGQLFESSVTQGKPITFALYKMSPGWVEGVGMMVAGEKRRLWMPEALAYPDGTAGPGQPRGMLVFDLELIAFEDTPTIGIGVPTDE